MTWHKLKQTTFKNLSRAQGKKHKRKKRNVVEGFFQTGKCFEKEGKKEKRPLIMRYDFTVPTEDLKSMKKNKDRSLHTLLQSAHADMSARATRIQILVFCGKL